MRSKHDEGEIEAGMIGLAIIIAGLFALVVLSGCTTANFKHTSKDGRTFEGSITSWVWDREFKKFRFDYEKGILEVDAFHSSTDKETAGKALDTAKSAIDLARSAL